MEALAGPHLVLQMVSSRGTMVYPATGLGADDVRLWRCRFVSPDEMDVDDEVFLALLGRIAKKQPLWTHIEKLHVFNGEPGFTKAQGQ